MPTSVFTDYAWRRGADLLSSVLQKEVIKKGDNWSREKNSQQRAIFIHRHNQSEFFCVHSLQRYHFCGTAPLYELFMARKKKEKQLQPNIKVRLDRRTIITVRDQEKLEFWRQKYPNLEIIEEL